MGILVSPSVSFKEEKGLSCPLHWKRKNSLSLYESYMFSPKATNPQLSPVLLYRPGGGTSIQGPRQKPAVPFVPKENVPAYRA